MSYVESLKKQVVSSILKLTHQRDAIDAQLRPLVDVMKSLDKDSPGVARRQPKAKKAKNLSRKQRTAILRQMLTRSKGLTIKALAEKLGCTENAAWSRLEREVKQDRAVKLKRGLYGVKK